MCRPERSPRRLQKKILLLRKKPIKMGEKKSEQEGFYPFDTQAHRVSGHCSHAVPPNYTADIHEGVAVEYVSCEPLDGLKELSPEGCGAEIILREQKQSRRKPAPYIRFICDYNAG